MEYDEKVNSYENLVRADQNIAGRLEKLRNRYAGKRCFIMGNGPSINRMDLGLLKNEVVWGFNKCYLLFDKINWRPMFYVTNDKRLTAHIASEIDQLVRQTDTCTFFFPSHYHQLGIIQPYSNTYWFLEIPWRNEQDHVTPFFSKDPSQYVSSAATVTIAGLQLAAYLGFNPIYLIGCDTAYSIPDTVLYEDSEGHDIVSTSDNDPNHFSPDYSGRGDKWTMPDVELMIYQYEQSKTALDEMGIHVYNATFGGKLEVFPRIIFKDIFI